MAKYAAHATGIFLDEFDISGFLNSTQQGVTQEVPVTTCFRDAGPRRVVGNYDVEHSDLGLFDGDDDSIDEIIHTLLQDTGDHYLAKLFGATAEGGIAYESIVKLMSEPRSAQLGGAVMLNFDSRGAGGLVRGDVLAHATVTGAGNRTGINQGAKSSGPTYQVIFRLLAFDGTDITLKVQESQNDGSPDTYADVTGLTSGSLSAVGVVRATTTAALEAWRRVNISTSGGFTSALILVTGGLVAGTS